MKRFILSIAFMCCIAFAQADMFTGPPPYQQAQQRQSTYAEELQAGAGIVQAAQGIDNMYGFLLALLSLLGIIGKGFFDGKKHRSHEDFEKRSEKKFDILFGYNEKRKDEISSLQAYNKLVESLGADIRTMNNSIGEVNKQLGELVGIQKVLLAKGKE